MSSTVNIAYVGFAWKTVGDELVEVPSHRIQQIASKEDFAFLEGFTTKGDLTIILADGKKVLIDGNSRKKSRQTPNGFLYLGAQKLG